MDLNLVENQQQLEDMVAGFEPGAEFHADTEFLRERTYFPLLCLVQIQHRNRIWCVDAIRLKDLGPLAEWLRARAQVCVFHAGRQDQEALQTRQLEIAIPVFDTQVAAAFCGYGHQLSYAALVKEICHIELDKSQTRTDWSRRPMTAKQLAYAADDVAYLPQLREYFERQLEARGRLEWLRQDCARIYHSREPQNQPQQAWRRLKGGSRLPPRLQSTARALAVWRERKAQKVNRPREWILSTRALMEIARKQPKSVADCERLSELPKGVVRRRGREIVDIVARHADESGGDIIWSPADEFDNKQKKRVRQIMKVIRTIAEQEDIMPGLLATRPEIEAMVAGEPREHPLRSGWRAELVGALIAPYMD